VLLVKELIARTAKPAYLPVREHVARRIYARGAALLPEREIPLVELDLAGADRTDFKPAGWSILPRILPAREVAEDDVFIDYGSGMGRVVYEAATRYRFKRVIGLELSATLNQIARSNLDRNRERLRGVEIQLVTGDAVDYRPPPEVTIAFFNNPFGGRILQTALHRLLAVAGRRLRIIYHNPVEHEMLMRMDGVTQRKRLRGWRPGKEWSRSNTTVLYECLPRSRP
jgi:precorrin-6B methylase 2